MTRRFSTDLDWSSVALTGDVGAVPGLVTVAPQVRRRSRKLAAVLLLAWLAWEGAGVLRAVAVGSEVLPVVWAPVLERMQ